jgi:hypothetical protein
LAVFALPFPDIREISIIPAHATKRTHIIFVCRTTTAKAPTYINNIEFVTAALINTITNNNIVLKEK